MTANEVDGALALPIEEVGPAILRLHEDQWFDRKSIKIQMRTLAESLVALANSDGGVVDNAVAVGSVIIVGTPKAHRVRSVPIPKFLRRLLIDEVDGKGPEELLFGDGTTHVPLPHSVRGWLQGAINRIQKRDPGFPRLTPHELRHTAASLAVSSGANVKAVQRMLGHASAAMTLDVYADLFDDDLDTVAKSLEAARRKAVGKAA